MKSMLCCYDSAIVYLQHCVIYLCEWKCYLQLFVKNNQTDQNII